MDWKVWMKDHAKQHNDIDEYLMKMKRAVIGLENDISELQRIVKVK